MEDHFSIYIPRHRIDPSDPPTLIETDRLPLWLDHVPFPTSFSPRSALIVFLTPPSPPFGASFIILLLSNALSFSYVNPTVVTETG
jgi:hypothetical protein